MTEGAVLEEEAAAGPAFEAAGCVLLVHAVSATSDAKQKSLGHPLAIRNMIGPLVSLRKMMPILTSLQFPCKSSTTQDVCFHDFIAPHG